MPASYRSANAFTQAFLSGFNTVRGFSEDRDRKKMLEQRLAEERAERAHQRKRQDQLDAERAEDRAFAATERDYQVEQRRRAREATALLSDPNVSNDALMPYRDIPEVAAFMTARTKDQELQADAGYIFGQDHSATFGPGAGGTQPQGNQMQGAVVEAAQLPGAPGERVPVVSAHELNRMADQDPQAAQQYRNQMRQQQEQTGEGMTIMESIMEPPHERKERLERRRRIEAETATVNDQWTQFYDVNDEAGDELRRVDSNVLVDMYYEDRNTLDPKLQANVDKRMHQHVAKSIDQYTTILRNADPASPEANSARMELSKAYGVASAIGHSYQPLRLNGVDGRGLPNNNANQALTDSVIANSVQQPGMPYPDNPNTTRADLTIVERGAKGKRIPERFAQASWRLLKGGIINQTQYESLMRTGRLPGAAPTIKDHDPKKDLIAQYPDGSIKVVIPARNPDEDGVDYLRNTIGDDALSQLNKIASALDDESDSARGTRALASFAAVLAANENKARARGYDFSNVNDMMSLYQRYIDIGYFRDAYNDEWRYNGDWNPDFSQDFGTIGDALFAEGVDTATRSGEFEAVNERGGVTPLKSYNPAYIQALIAQGLAQTPEEAAALLAERGF